MVTKYLIQFDWRETNHCLLLKTTFMMNLEGAISACFFLGIHSDFIMNAGLSLLKVCFHPKWRLHCPQTCETELHYHQPSTGLSSCCPAWPWVWSFHNTDSSWQENEYNQKNRKLNKVAFKERGSEDCDSLKEEECPRVSAPLHCNNSEIF